MYILGATSKACQRCQNTTLRPATHDSCHEGCDIGTRFRKGTTSEQARGPGLLLLRIHEKAIGAINAAHRLSRICTLVIMASSTLPISYDGGG